MRKLNRNIMIAIYRDRKLPQEESPARDSKRGEIKSPEDFRAIVMPLKDDERALHQALISVARAPHSSCAQEAQRQPEVVESTLGNVKAKFDSDLQKLNTASVSDSTIIRAQNHLWMDEKTSEKFLQAPVFRNVPDADANVSEY